MTRKLCTILWIKLYSCISVDCIAHYSQVANLGDRGFGYCSNNSNHMI